MPRTLIQAVAISVLSHVSLAGSRVVVPLIALQEGAQAATVGLLGALFTVLPMLLSAHVGRHLDRIGLRMPLMSACAMACGGMLLGACWPTTAMLYLVTPLVGSGAMLVYLVSTEMVGGSGGPSERPRNFALLSMGYSGSAFGGPLLAGLAFEHLGRSGAFLCLAAFPTLALGLAIATRRSWRGAPAGRSGTPAAGPRAVPRLAGLLRAPGLAMVLTTGAMVAAGQNLFAFVVPIHATQHGLTAVQVGQVMAAFAVGAFAIRAVLPLLSRRLGARALVMVALTVAGLAYATFPAARSVAPLLAVSTVLGVAIGLVQPTLMSLLYAASPADRLNEAAGLNVALNNAAQTAVPLAFGILGGALGIGVVCWVFAAALAANASLARRIGDDAGRRPR